MNRLKTFGPRIKVFDTRTAKPPAIKVVDDYYDSPEHKAWRLAVLRKAGWQCEMIVDGVRCHRRHPERMFADHIIERRDDPSKALDIDNGQCLCGAHHSEKTHAERVKRGERQYGNEG